MVAGAGEGEDARVTLGFLTHTIDSWLSSYRYLVVFLLVMIESIGIPVPGETALIGAALYAGSTHKLEIWWVIAVAAAGAIIGDNIGFAIGRYGGAKVLLRHGHRIRLHEGRLKIGIWLFRRHGGKVVFWGRFVSVLRTYAAFLAGTNRHGVGALPGLQRGRRDRLGHDLRRRLLRVRQCAAAAEHCDRRLARRLGRRGAR
jgi:membrane protein YqaA with SNARE-associated domain